MPPAKPKATTLLSRLGLSENEAVLYNLLLKKTQCTVQEMQTWSPFSRTMLYHVLTQLEQRGLVSSRKDDWKTVYVAESPQQLYRLLEQREHQFAEQKQDIQKLIPQLKKRHRLAGKRPDIQIFEGLKEYKRALDDILLSKPKMISAYSSAMNSKVPGIEFRESHERKRLARNIPKRNLLFESPKSRQYLKKLPYHDLTQFRLIGAGTKAFSTDFQLYSGKILYTTYVDREPIAVLIEDQLLSEMQQNLFDALWDTAEPASLLSYE